MKKNKNLTASLEHYLRAIDFIVKEKQAARVKDISKYLTIGPSSVSEALRNLADRELINYEPYGIVTLTSEGKKIAKQISHRHGIICNFLENVLQVEQEQVEENASKIEHEVSDEVLTKFVRFLEFMNTCSCKEPKWVKSFKYYSQNGDLQDKCKKCTAITKENPEKMDNSHCCGVVN
ncbi:MAG: iron (metal) dependent repressor, DtxR family [uncultured bacterium]|nr:MAG: iron (metal) dependent repressor, DtxR family [uncultured bacterium]HBH18977.1 metal-dependent transcriptional regulator [Cyanobacteria bacterium UBA9579]